MLTCFLMITDSMAFKAKGLLRLTAPEGNEYATKKISGLMKNKRFSEAELLLNQSLKWPYSRDSLEMLRIRTELYRKKNDFIGEAKTYDDILHINPDDNDAIRGRVFALLHLGAPHLAWQYARLKPEVFAREELLSIHSAAIDKTIAWGRLEEKNGRGQQRFATTDKGLSENNRLLLTPGLSETDKVSQTVKQQYEFNQILALRDRSRMRETIDRYHQLKNHADIPAPVLAAAADAYVYLRRPKPAIDLYLQAINKPGKADIESLWEWQLNLVNAYIDANEFDAAHNLIDRLMVEIPPVLNKAMRGVEIDNKFHEEAGVTQAQQRMYSDQYQEGQALLEKLLASAPANNGARLAYGDLLQFREQPRAAQRQYASVLVDDPASEVAATGIAETAVYLQDFQTAQTQLNSLWRHYPENLEVRRVRQLLDAYQSPLFTVASGWGTSPTGGGRRGNEDWQVDASQYSPVFKRHWRLFAHSFNAEAFFDETKGVRRRVGIGADYRSPSWRISSEINQDQQRLDNYGASVRASWLPDDHWGLDLGYDNNGNDIPLQASASGVSMDAVKLGLNYVWDESRSMNADLSYGWFSDNNRRIEAGFNWQERWWSGPVYKLDTALGLYASDNSRRNADYFNPSKDLAIEAQMINEWMLWRNYRRNFKHRLIFGIGHYWQERFASGMIARLRYEQEWNFDPIRSLSYGAVYERHPYDGAMNELTSIFLNFNWHF